MSVRRLVAAGCGLALLAPLAAPAAAAPPPSTATVVREANTWLASSQQADGGFELAKFVGFETSDVVLATAQSRQSGPAWDAAAARAAVTGLVSSGGKDPLDAIDDLIDAEAEPGSVAAGARAAKVAAIVAQPLGISAADFDPSGDSAQPVDLFARMDLHRKAGGTYDFGAQFNGVLYVAIARAGAGLDASTGLVAQILAGQRADGSWDYTGTPAGGDGEDIDTTSLALVALRSSGRTLADPAVKKAVGWLAARHQANGAWQAFGADDPNATAVATVALSDLHVDLGTSAWLTAAGVAAPARYVSPWAWLATQQNTEGRIVSPNDSYGINTLATSQSVQALTRQWYLSREHAALTSKLSRTLGSPAATPSDRAADDAASALGPNPSIQSARSGAAWSVLNSADGRGAAAADLYVRAMGRTIDPSGLAYWSGVLVGTSRPEVLARLTGSAEFYRAAGGDDADFVDAVYQSVFGRDADAQGQTYWLARLQAGTPSLQVARSLTASPEYRRQQVATAYARVLNRPVDLEGQAFWTAKLANTRVEVLLANLGSSRELYDKLGS